MKSETFTVKTNDSFSAKPFSSDYLRPFTLQQCCVSKDLCIHFHIFLFFFTLFIYLFDTEEKRATTYRDSEMTSYHETRPNKLSNHKLQNTRRVALFSTFLLARNPLQNLTGI